MTQQIEYRRLKLMAEVQCWAIWDMDGVDNIDPLTLPICASLANEINKWSDVLDDSYKLEDPNFHLNSSTSIKTEVDEFNELGWELLAKLRQEMPKVEWWYRDGRHTVLLQKRPL